jgi:hypothetical protein
MPNIAIRGHKTRGEEVIRTLEMLGAVNIHYCTGGCDFIYYYVDEDNIIYPFSQYPNAPIFTLEEFLEKFPYKVGDNVIHSDYESPLEIVGMKLEDDSIKYEVYTDDYGYWFSVDELQPYKEEAMEEIKIDIPKGYEFAGIDNQQVVFEKVKPKYPKTYEECKASGFSSNPVIVAQAQGIPIATLAKLIVIRNEYWKIYGEQMGLGKPWKPDFTNNDEERYSIYTLANKVEKDFCGVGDVNTILCFPTEEMRDAFFENFGHLIELCKELL